MAGSQITVSQTQLESQRYGYQAVSLTNFAGLSEPQIAAGSKVEIGGALFNFSANESATGWAGIGVGSDVWIKLVVSGTSVTAVFTTTPPTWSASKQGWYSGDDRYVAWLRKDSSGNARYKRIITEQQSDHINFEFTLEIGDWDMTAALSKNVFHYFNHLKIRNVTAIIRDDTDTNVFDIVNIDSVSGSIDGGINGINSTLISLAITAGGDFNTTNFDSTSYNRGWVYFLIEAL